MSTSDEVQIWVTKYQLIENKIPKTSRCEIRIFDCKGISKSDTVVYFKMFNLCHAVCSEHTDLPKNMCATFRISELILFS